MRCVSALSVTSIGKVALRVRFRYTLKFFFIEWQNGFFLFFACSFCRLSFFFISITKKNCDNKFHSYAKTPDTTQIYWPIKKLFAIFLFFLHALLIDEIKMSFKQKQKKIIFIKIVARPSLVIICFVFNKSSPMNIRIFLNQLIVFYWVIPQNIEHDSLRQNKKKTVLIWFVNFFNLIVHISMREW